MKYSPFIACTLLFSAQTLVAQETKVFPDIKPVVIQLKDIWAELPPNASLFRNFVVVDQRPDTARIGIHTRYTTFHHAHDCQLMFRQTAAREIEAFLNSHFSRPDAPYTAFIVLRTLWLSDASYIREDMIRDPDKLYEKTHIRLKAELYAARDSQYIPIFRYDTLQITRRTRNKYFEKSSYSSWDEDLAALIGNLADSASLTTARKAGQSRTIGLEDIIRFNQSRFDNPINEGKPLKPGVYTGFDEFRDNAPSIANFEIKMENGARLLYIREAGGSVYYSHKAWGYCDGKNVYVMRDGYLQQAWRVGKAWYFYALSDKEVYTIGPDGTPRSSSPLTGKPGPAGTPSAATPDGSLVGIAKEELHEHRIYTIDMDTGMFY
jgi:hypothetical protein